MKILKYISLILVALLCLNLASAWLDPATETEKEYFKENIWNLSKKNFGGFGIVFGSSDMQASTYAYTKQTLPKSEWGSVFKDAFETDPESWTEVYDYVLNAIKERDYFETSGYFNLENDTYWINDIDMRRTSLEGDLISPDTKDIVGNISLKQVFWSFWTGDVNLNEERYRVLMLRFGV